MSSPVFFITGVSSGFGTQIALKALEAGCTVVGTVRSRQRAAKEVKQIESQGGTCVEFDVTDIPACSAIIKQIEQKHGRIDVLINNAGMSYLGAIADFTDAEAKAQMEVNFHGPLRLINAVLPGMRERKSGTIVNVTSIAGIDAVPSSGMYAASKFALEGLSEGLQREVKEHNIWVLVVEPGAFRTNFLAAFKTTEASSREHYTAAQAGLDKFASMEGKQKGDPVKGAERIVEAIVGKGVAGKVKEQTLRMPLGPDCVARYEAKMASMKKDLDTVRDVAMSTDIDE